MQLTNYWKQFEHTGRVEDYLKYRQENTVEQASALCREHCTAAERTDGAAGEDGSCRNPCM